MIWMLFLHALLLVPLCSSYFFFMVNAYLDDWYYKLIFILYQLKINEYMNMAQLKPNMCL